VLLIFLPSVLKRVYSIATYPLIDIFTHIRKNEFISIFVPTCEERKWWQPDSTPKTLRRRRATSWTSGGLIASIADQNKRARDLRESTGSNRGIDLCSSIQQPWG